MARISHLCLVVDILFLYSCATNHFSDTEYDDLYYSPVTLDSDNQSNLPVRQIGFDTIIADAKKIYFSVFSGLSFTQFQGDSEDFVKLINNTSGLALEKKWRSLLFPVGLSASYNASSWLTLKSGIMFAPKGIKYSDKLDIGGEEYQVNLILKLNYIEVPFLAEISTPIDKYAKLYLEGGISPAFKVTSMIISKAWKINSYPGQSDTATQKEDWNDVGKIDLGYTVGCGFKGQTTYLGVQYEKGLKSVSTTGWNFKNESITVLLGFFF